MNSSGKYLLCSCRWNCCCVRYSSILQLLVSLMKQLLFLSLISFFPLLHIANNKSALRSWFRKTNKAWCCFSVVWGSWMRFICPRGKEMWNVPVSPCIACQPSVPRLVLTPSEPEKRPRVGLIYSKSQVLHKFAHKSLCPLVANCQRSFPRRKQLLRTLVLNTK